MGNSCAPSWPSAATLTAANAPQQHLRATNSEAEARRERQNDAKLESEMDGILSAYERRDGLRRRRVRQLEELRVRPCMQASCGAVGGNVTLNEWWWAFTFNQNKRLENTSYIHADSARKQKVGRRM